jgi:hypothetical protein
MNQEESNNAMNSSSKLPLRTLARQLSTEVVAGFLVESANLDWENLTQDAAKRYYLKYTDLLPSLNKAVLKKTGENSLTARNPHSPLGVGALVMSTPLKLSRPGSPDIHFDLGPARMLAELLKDAWKQPTSLSRELKIFCLQRDLLGLHALREDPVESFKTDKLMFLILRAVFLAEKMRYCANPECPAPYFLAKRRSQKYCTQECALPAQREFKKAWWAEHGENWRQTRRESQTRGKARRRKGGKRT